MIATADTKTEDIVIAAKHEIKNAKERVAFLNSLGLVTCARKTESQIKEAIILSYAYEPILISTKEESTKWQLFCLAPAPGTTRDELLPFLRGADLLLITEKTNFVNLGNV